MAAAATLVKAPVLHHRVTFAAEDNVHRYNADYPSTLATASKSPSYRSSRPDHKRRRSRQGSIDVLHDLSLAFGKALGKGWGSAENLKNLARDFFAVAVGFSAGHKIRGYKLDRSHTAHLALDLSKTMDTTNIVMVLDTTLETLYIVHTQLLNGRFQAYQKGEDTTVFLQVRNGIPVVTGQPAFLTEATNHLKRWLSQSNRQVFQTTDFDWSPFDTSYRMLTVGDWLTNLPVCYIVESGLGQGKACLRDHLAKGQLFWHLRAQVEGVDQENDHVFEGCRVPLALFSDDPELSSPRPDQPPPDRARSLNFMQDCLQTRLYERLDGSRLAMSMWSDVTASVSGPDPF